MEFGDINQLMQDRSSNTYICMHHIFQYGLHGGGGGGELAGGAGVTVLRSQMWTQRAEQSPDTRTLHVVKKKSRVFRIGAISMTLLHTSALKPSHFGAQIARQSSCMSAIADGDTDKKITSAVMQAAILSMVVAAMVIRSMDRIGSDYLAAGSS